MEIDYIPCHNCSLCGGEVAYRIIIGAVYFDPNCSCLKGERPMEPRSWDDLSDWLNMQTNDQARKQIMSHLGFNVGVNK